MPGKRHADMLLLSTIILQSTQVRFIHQLADSGLMHTCTPDHLTACRSPAAAASCALCLRPHQPAAWE